MADLSEDDRKQFEEIRIKLIELKGVLNARLLPIHMQLFLKSKAAAWHDHKCTSHRANTRAVVQDARITLERMKDEVSYILCQGIYTNHCLAHRSHCTYRHANISICCQRQAWAPNGKLRHSLGSRLSLPITWHEKEHNRHCQRIWIICVYWYWRYACVSYTVYLRLIDHINIGLVHSHNDKLGRLKANIRQEICNGLSMNNSFNASHWPDKVFQSQLQEIWKQKCIMISTRRFWL